MTVRPIRVGIIGIKAGVTWASTAHVPALRHLSDDYEIFGLANRSHQSAVAAADASGVARAFRSVDELIACPDIDMVTVTVRVPHHFEIVSAAIEASKHVYCEWPLGNGLSEAVVLAELAGTSDRVCVAGMQATNAPEVALAKRLVDDGYVGRVLSTSLIGSGMLWGPTIQLRNTYLLDPKNGATMLTIPVAHTLAAVEHVLGPIASVQASLRSRRKEALVSETQEVIPMFAADQILMMGELASGAPMSLHYRGGVPRGVGLYWEIHGSEGDFIIEAVNGHAQMVQLSIRGGRSGDAALQALAVPDTYLKDWPTLPGPRNVAIMYKKMADDIRTGSRTATSFAEAVRLHQIVEAMEVSSSTQSRCDVG
jgi:predicted dehydrogenase